MIHTAELLTIPDVVRRTGFSYTAVLRTIERGLWRGDVRVGRNRLIPIEGLVALEKAAIGAGYAPATKRRK